MIRKLVPLKKLGPKTPRPNRALLAAVAFGFNRAWVLAIGENTALILVRGYGPEMGVDAVTRLTKETR